MGGGTYHKPPIHNKGKFVIHESSSCLHYLLSEYPPENLLREWRLMIQFKWLFLF